jgi:hypothetical protein
MEAAMHQFQRLNPWTDGSDFDDESRRVEDVMMSFRLFFKYVTPRWYVHP